MDEIMNTPFTPMMLAVNSFLDQQEITKAEEEEIDLSDKRVTTAILSKQPTKSNQEFIFE